MPKLYKNGKEIAKIEVFEGGSVDAQGTIDITENGEVDVSTYKNANVNVPIPEGYIKPSGEIKITDTNEVDVLEYAKAQVIDANLIPSNIRLGKSILGIEGNLEADKPDQEKTIIPNENRQEIIADTGYELAKVIVEPIPSDYLVPNGTKQITTNGTHDISSYANANVNVPIPEGYIQPSGVETITENGMYNITEKEYVNVGVVATEYEEKECTLTANTSSYIHTPSPSVRYSKITINATPTQTTSITPTTSKQEIKPVGYFLSEVSVEAIPSEYVVPSGNLEITENGDYNVNEKASVSVNVPTGISVEGTKEITSNGDYDVSTYANASVNVPIPDEYLIPSGSKTITSNGIHDISTYKNVDVNVPLPEGSAEIAENGTYNVYDYEEVKVNVPIPEGYIQPSGTKTINQNGTYNIEEYASVEVICESGSSGSSGVVEVEELPTENVQEDTLYKVNEVSDINVYVRTNDYTPSTMQEMIASTGATPNITYYLVDSLPESPNVSDMATFSETHVYIYEDIAYVYCDVGYGEMWLDLATLLSSMAEGFTYTNKGYVSSLNEVGEQGICVTYKLGTYGVSNKFCVEVYEGEWIDYKSIFNKSITTFSHSNISEILDYSFHYCASLTSVNLPNAISIGEKGFAYCGSLTSVNLPNATKIESGAFIYCTSLTSINLPKVVSIGSSALLNCSSLTTLYLPNATNIGDSALQNCSSLTDLYLGYEGVVSLGSTQFYGCPNTKVHVRAEYLSAYQNDENWKNAINDQGITLVGDYTD